MTAAIRQSEETLYSQLADFEPETKKQKRARKRMLKTKQTLNADQNINTKERSCSLDLASIAVPLISSATRRLAMSTSKPSSLTCANPNDMQIDTKAKKEQRGNDSTCSVLDESPNEVLRELHLMNAQLGYLCLKKLQTSSKSCHFISSSAPSVVRKEKTESSDLSSKIPIASVLDANVNTLGIADQSMIDMHNLSEKQKNYIGPRGDVDRKEKRATWAEVATVLNRGWGLVYLLASIAAFWLFLLPLLNVVMNPQDSTESRFLKNRMGCSASE